MPHLPLAAAEVNRLGVVNYFDSQRFGSLKHGQGFIAKDLLRGDFEAALKNYLAQPSDARPHRRRQGEGVLARALGRLGRAAARSRPAGSYDRILRSLRERPTDFLRAFLQIDADYRALLLFTYQSWLWNEGVRRLLQTSPAPDQPLPHAATRRAPSCFTPTRTRRRWRFLRSADLPAAGAGDAPVGAAHCRGRQLGAGQREADARSRCASPRQSGCSTSSTRSARCWCSRSKLVLGRVAPDELNRGLSKLNVAFTLSPGSYATLVVKRLFHRAGAPAEEPKGADIPWRSGAHTPYVSRAPGERQAASPSPTPARAAPRALLAQQPAARPAPSPVPAPPVAGFRAQAAAKKRARAAARAADRGLRKPSKA